MPPAGGCGSGASGEFALEVGFGAAGGTLWLGATLWPDGALWPGGACAYAGVAKQTTATMAAAKAPNRLRTRRC